MQKIISITIPVYQNKGTLKDTHNYIASLFKEELSNYAYEIIFIDDGSYDGSIHELKSLVSFDSNVKVIKFTRNFGQIPAIIAGLKEAKGDAIVNISADLQDPINLIVDMVKLWESGSKIVVSHRVSRDDPLLAKLYSKFAYKILKAAVSNMPEGGFDFVLMDKLAVCAFNRIDARNRFFQGDILELGYKTSFIPYHRKKREVGCSQFSFFRKLKAFIDALLDVSYVPIRVISLAGVVTAFCGGVYALSIVYAYFFRKVPFTGWAPIVILILIIGGGIMVMLGVLGEYVWRIYDEVRRKPQYIIDEIITKND